MRAGTQSFSLLAASPICALSSLIVEPDTYHFSAFTNSGAQWRGGNGLSILTGAGCSEARVGYGKGKTEGGHKRGHGAMALWVAHQETKTAAGQQRRLAARRLERKAAKETRRVASTRPSRGRDGRMARPPDQCRRPGRHLRLAANR
jgi:hypothetical protein